MSQSKGLTLEDIEDDEDIYSRIHTNKIKKLKRKQIREHGGHDDEHDKPLYLSDKVSQIEDKLHNRDKPKNLTPLRTTTKDDPPADSLTISDRAEIILWILDNFESISLQKYFPEDQLYLHTNLFRLYVYSAKHRQTKFFNSEFKKLYRNTLLVLVRAVKLKKSFDDKFVDKQPVKKSPKKVGRVRKVEHVEIPATILKRLDADPQ